MHSESSNEGQKKRGPYKRYFWDANVPIPESTVRSMSKRMKEASGDGSGEISQDPDSPPVEPEDTQDPPPQEVAHDPLLEPQDMEDPPQEMSHDPAPEPRFEEQIQDNEHNEDEAVDGLEQDDSGAEQRPVSSRARSFEVRHRLNEPFHNAINCTRLDVLLMILHLAYRHCNTQHFVEDQIKFVNSLIGSNAFDVSYHIYQKLFSPSAASVRHYFCPDCEVLVASQDKLPDDAKFAKCPKCEKDINVHSVDSNNYFVTLNLKDQIEDILQRQNEEIKIKHANVTGELCDIFDGEIYRNCLKPGAPLAGKLAFTVTFNTDGVKLFKSVKNTMYPIFLHLNELPPEERFKTENLILGGLWFGKSSPNMPMFLKPFLEEQLKLSDPGVDYRKPDGSVVKCPVYPLVGSFDSVAKAKVLCMKQFNGICGCLYCLHPNDAVVNVPGVPVNRLHRHYDTSVTYPLRTENEVISDMYNADTLQREGRLQKDETIRGFFALSVLLTIVSQQLQSFNFSMFNIVWSVAIDYMHAILEGVTADLLSVYESLLTPAEYKILSDRIVKIAPPQAMTRRPRALSERVHWKAKEYRSFLLYYSLPCLEDLLPLAHFSILKKFVHACYILLSDRISAEALAQAENCMKSFVTGFQRLYGLGKVTYNLHLCTHLVNMVRKLGPLWCYSNFVFESGNGLLTRLLKGTRSVVNEIAGKFSTLHTVAKVIKKNPVSDNTLHFCNEVLCVQYSKSTMKVNDVAVPVPHSYVDVDPVESFLLEEKNVLISSGKVKFFHRAIYKGMIFCSQLYSKGKVFDDSCVMLKDSTYATIDKIVINVTGDILCVIKPIHIAPNDLIPYIKRCCIHVYDIKKIVPFSDIEKKCVFVSVGNKNFVCIPPNLYERD